jgi:hypothetical protein
MHDPTKLPPIELAQRQRIVPRRFAGQGDMTERRLLMRNLRALAPRLTRNQ